MPEGVWEAAVELDGYAPEGVRKEGKGGLICKYESWLCIRSEGVFRTGAVCFGVGWAKP